MTDRLTQLPAELFITICELVHESKEGPYLALISRAFVPVARRLAFRMVEVKQYDHLQALCEVIVGSRPVAECIEELDLDMTASRPDVGAPRTALLTSTFRRLTRVRSMRVTTSSRLAKLAVSPTPMSLPSLTTIHIADPFHGWANPFDPVNLRLLHEYSNLSALFLRIDRSVDSLGRYRSASGPTPQLGHVDWLHLQGPLSGNAAVPVLLASFGHIRGIRLCDTVPSGEAALPFLLRNVPAPDAVDVLALAQWIGYPRSLVDVLPSYSSLKFLELGLRAWSSAMLPVLHKFHHLEEVVFLLGADISTADLCDMIRGPNKLDKLERMSIDVLWTRHWPGSADEVLGWSSSFTLEGVVDLLSVVDEAGIVLEGLAVDLARELVEDRRAAAFRLAAQGRGGV
ncbi:hypothetical protein JCM8208_006084 [Rhodotorula glutinis]